MTYLVDTHIPDDHTFRLCFTSYDIPANRVLASFGNVDDSSSSSIFDNHPRRKRDTAPGLGLAISKSLSAGTRRVSEKVDLTLHRRRVLFDRLSCSPKMQRISKVVSEIYPHRNPFNESPYQTIHTSFSPNMIGAMVSSISSAVHAHRAPCDL